MTGINNFGNGIGYLYITDLLNSKLTGSFPNTSQGAKRLLEVAALAAPLPAQRSAYAIIEVTAAAATGNLTAITISGVNQIAANVPCTSATLAVVAASWAAAINAYTPASGYNYTAQALNQFVYLYAPPEAGSAPNGITPTISTSVPSLTASVTQDFINGSSNSGIVDDNLGSRFFIDPAVSAPSVPASFPISTDNEITKDIVMRGLQTGLPNIEVTIATDRITTNRYAALTRYIVDTEAAAASDYLAYINPANFIPGDRITLTPKDVAHVVTIVSAPVATAVSSVANPNIYLVDNAPYSMSAFTRSIELEYAYDPSLGGVFYEKGRSASVASNPTGNITYVSSALGSDETGKINRIDLPFASVNAAINAVTAAASTTNTINLLPGTYTITSAAAFLATCRINAADGASLTIDTSALSNTITALYITGNGAITWSKFIDVANFPNLATLQVNCTDWLTGTSTVNVTAPTLDYNITAMRTMRFPGTLTFDTNSGQVYSRIVLNAPEPEFQNGIYHTNSNISLYVNPSSGKAKGYVNLNNSTSKLFNFYINGTLEWLTNPAISAVTVQGNVWFNNYTNFLRGFFIRDSIITTSDVPVYNLTNARIFITNEVKHKLNTTLTDVPTIRINSTTGASTLRIDSKSIVCLDSIGTSGIVYINNSAFVHTVIAQGFFGNLSLNGNVFVAAIASANILNSGVQSNVTVLGANTTQTNTTATPNAALI